MPHVFHEEPVYLSEGKYTYASECCGEAATVTQRKPGSELYETIFLESCFEGRHTTAAERVKYNGINILRCQYDRNGLCARPHLFAQDGVAIFRYSVPRVESDVKDRVAAGIWVPQYV